MEKAILKTIKYFFFFNYFPDFEEIYIFLSKKTSRRILQEKLDNLLDKKIIIKFPISNFPHFAKASRGEQFPNKSQIPNPKFQIKDSDNPYGYTLVEYGIKISNIKYQISKRKLQNWKFRLYLKLLSFFPQIKLVGLSGSVAMMNAREGDDIDLFIITAKNRLFTGRFIALFLAQIFGLRRKRKNNVSCFMFHASCNKVCLNLFFDESNLSVPDFKKTEYVAHEVLQMKPIIDKSQTYGKFLKANQWVLEMFPNAKEIFNLQFTIFNQFSKNNFQISNWVERLLKKYQKQLIDKHRTNELISDDQLWFHPTDFGKKVANFD